MWIDAATPLVGEDNAESATDMLLGMCMAEPYGEEAVEKYAADPDSTAFNCYFLGGVEKFVMSGDTITGLDAQGQEVFAHTYQKLDVDNRHPSVSSVWRGRTQQRSCWICRHFAPDNTQ